MSGSETNGEPQRGQNWRLTSSSVSVPIVT